MNEDLTNRFDHLFSEFFFKNDSLAGSAAQLEVCSPHAIPVCHFRSVLLETTRKWEDLRVDFGRHRVYHLPPRFSHGHDIMCETIKYKLKLITYYVATDISSRYTRARPVSRHIASRNLDHIRSASSRKKGHTGPNCTGNLLKDVALRQSSAAGTAQPGSWMLLNQGPQAECEAAWQKFCCAHTVTACISTCKRNTPTMSSIKSSQ